MEQQEFKSAIEQKKVQYHDYIDEHRANVKQAWLTLKPKINHGTFWVADEEINDLELNIERHDAIKYEDIEFKAYRNKYYPAEGEKIDETAFQYAWLHHQNHCPHHLEYWHLRQGNNVIALDMPLIFVLECLLDWQAMGIKFANSALWYWNENKDHLIVSKNTYNLFEKWSVLFRE
ncbi:MAG: DUF5662 family protein [Aminipila sp.]